MDQTEKTNSEIDSELLKATLLLMDHKYGKSRTEKVRLAIQNLPKYPRLYRALAPLNCFVTMAAEDPLHVMKLLDAIDIKREKEIAALKKRLATNTATVIERRKDNRRENAANYRRRLKNVIIVAELELGRRMTKDERDQLIAKMREQWKTDLENEVLASPGETRQEVAHRVVDNLDEFWQRQADEALAKLKKTKLNAQLNSMAKAN